MRDLGTVVRGIRTPIIKENDDLGSIVVESIMNASKNNGFEFHDRDIVAITEAVVGISEGNYVTVDEVAEDIRNKFHNPEDLGIVFPILSRNRFSIILKAIARSTKKLYVLLSFPSDEVGNGILDEEKLDKSNFNMGSIITEEDYKKYFGDWLHPFTGINMIDFYRDLIKGEGCEVEFILSNKATDILKYTNNVLACDIHTRFKTKKALEEEGALVRRLVEEIREKKYYVPQLEFVMVNQNDEVMGYVMFSRFHLEGKYDNELLLLSPVAVKTQLQRQHISKELIEYGFEKAKELGYKVVIVEGDPRNYRSRGFVTSAEHGIFAAPSVGLPAPECLMVKELTEGALDNINGVVDYSFYECLR